MTMLKRLYLAVLLVLFATPLTADVISIGLNRALANALYCQKAGCTMTGTFTPTALGRFTTAGSAPTPTLQTATFGTTPTVSMAAGSTDAAGAINIAIGTVPANSTGTVRLAFTSVFGTNAPVCMWTLQNNTGAYSPRATVIVDGPNNTTAQSQILLDNNAVTWTASVTYQAAYICIGK